MNMKETLERINEKLALLASHLEQRACSPELRGFITTKIVVLELTRERVIAKNDPALYSE